MNNLRKEQTNIKKNKKLHRYDFSSKRTNDSIENKKSEDVLNVTKSKFSTAKCDDFMSYHNLGDNKLDERPVDIENENVDGKNIDCHDLHENL